MRTPPFRAMPPSHQLLLVLFALAVFACDARESSPGARKPLVTARTNPEPIDPARAIQAQTPTVKAPPLAFRAQELPFRYDRGESGSAWPVEVTGGGVGLLDFDHDGDLDLFFAQGVPLPVGSRTDPPADVLLRNDGDGRFNDVSTEAGLSSKGYGQGVTVADFDGDGDPDVYVTRYGTNTLWRNDGGRFTDATAEAGVGCPLWSLGAAFLDYDADGDLDLFVANYFAFNPADAPFERNADGRPEYGPPGQFDGLPDVLYRNDGQGRFTDVTDQAGVAGTGRGMGVLATDLDGDGRPDLLVANDAEANAVWRNRGDGTFEEVANDWGLALNGEGQPEANMGIALGDTDGDAIHDVIITHFVGEHDTLWRGLALPGGGIHFQDQTFQSGLGTDSKPLTGWGLALADFDLDGRLDLMVTNGHIRQERGQPYAIDNPPLLWHNQGNGRFANVTSTAGPYFQQLHSGRGLACGDLDGDGDLDLVIVHHRAPSVVLWNESPRRGHSLGLDLRGQGRNPDAIGARVTVTVGRQTLIRSIDSGGSYLSSHDPRIHLGLGPANRVDRVEVRWPSGQIEARSDLPADRVVHWIEGAPETTGTASSR